MKVRTITTANQRGNGCLIDWCGKTITTALFYLQGVCYETIEVVAQCWKAMLWITLSRDMHSGLMIPFTALQRAIGIWRTRFCWHLTLRRAPCTLILFDIHQCKLEYAFAASNGIHIWVTWLSSEVASGCSRFHLYIKRCFVKHALWLFFLPLPLGLGWYLHSIRFHLTFSRRITVFFL